LEYECIATSNWIIILESLANLFALELALPSSVNRVAIEPSQAIFYPGVGGYLIWLFVFVNPLDSANLPHSSLLITFVGDKCNAMGIFNYPNSS
jgi:hypothetical protein